MRAFIKFHKGIMRMPLPWRLWLMLLIAVNMVAPLFFLGRLEARMVLGAVFASMALMTIVTGVSGFTRLLGLGHILWLPLLYFLWMRLDQIPTGDFFGVWVRALMMLNGTSLVMDVVDVVRFVAGDRAETVEGL